MRVAISKIGPGYPVTAQVVDRQLSIEMELADFMAAVAAEIGPVTWVFRDATFRKRFDDAVAKVRNDLQKSSVMVV